jgi:holo-ACP synthase/triphosphoribosyl-dephospho-CoA synthase
LEAREERAFLKKQMALKGLPCVSLSLNVPGFPKSNSTVKTFFDFCLSDLKYFLKAHLNDIHYSDAIERCDTAGDFYIAPCSVGINTLAELKQICEAFETTHPFGRFIDVDLNDELGNTVSSGKSKVCFFCHERPAIECRREKAHDHEQLRMYMFSEMARYCSQQRKTIIIKQLTSLGLKALLSEISLTPKPGLVDKFSNGSHGDMNYQTFIDSSAAISPWMGELVEAGFSFKDTDLSKALPIIRNIGLRMESAMHQATHNVNTQKGIIFLLGLSMFACGRLFSESDQFDIEYFRSIIKEICKDMVKNEMINSFQARKSHGEEIFLNYGFTGARGEAESGFQIVFEHGLPPLKGFSKLNDDLLYKSFLSIASVNSDTNILYRGGPDVLSNFQGLCKTALENYNDHTYSEVIDYCQKENISPGGSADLLALTIFVWSVMNEPFLPIYSK